MVFHALDVLGNVIPILTAYPKALACGYVGDRPVSAVSLAVALLDLLMLVDGSVNSERIVNDTDNTLDVLCAA